MQYHVTGASVLFPFRPLTRVFRACRDRIALVYAQIDGCGARKGAADTTQGPIGWTNV